MNLDPHENVRAECDAAMAAFLAKGGKIDRLPNGAMAASGWKSEHYDPSSHTAKQRSMRNREIAKEEREALAVTMTARQLADLKGWPMNNTMQRLTRLREQGLVESKGSKGNMRWSAK